MCFRRQPSTESESLPEVDPLTPPDTRPASDPTSLRIETLFMNLFSSVSDGVCILDSNLRIVRLNSVMKRWFDLTDEAEGRLCSDVFPAGSVPCLQCPSRKALDTGEMHSVIFPTTFEEEDGESWIEIFSYPIKDESAGSIAGVILHMLDVTKRVTAERDLRKERDLFVGIAEASPSGIVRVSREGVITFANRRAAEILERPVQEILGMRFDSPDWGITAASTGMDEAAGRISFGDLPVRMIEDRDKPVFNIICPVTMKDGRKKILSVNAAPLDDPGGRRDGMISTVDDVTDTFGIRESLLRNEQFNNAILAESPIGISVRSNTGRLLSCNRAWQEIWGLSDEEVRIDMETPRPFLQLDERDRYIQKWAERIRHVYEKGGSLHVPELRSRRRRRDSAIWLSQRFYSILDPNGAVDRVVILTEDISEQKAAQIALQESEERYRTLTEASHDLIFALDCDDIVRFANSSAAKAIGLPPEEIMGRNRSELFDSARSEKQKKMLDRIMSSKESVYLEEKYNFPSGSRWLSIWLVPLENVGGDKPGVFGVARDISDRVEAERREASLREQLNFSQRMESIGRLAGGVAHDFNNLLTVILGHIELALECTPPGPHPVRASLMEIRKAGDRARDLTRQLLAFGRSQVLVMKEIDLNEVIRGFSSIVTRLIGEDVRIILDLDPSLGRIKADPGQIEQVIMNIVINSRDAMPDGGSISIATREVIRDSHPDDGGDASGPERWAELTISDTGTGIDENVLPHVFEPFYTTKDTGKGTGLGLSTVYGIVNQHEGLINVRSGPGEGTSFTIMLPMPGGAAGGGAEPGAPENRRSGKAASVMAAVEDPAVRGLVCSLLRRGGYRVVEVEDPRTAAVRAESEGPIDLLITDHMMNSMSGADAAGGVKAVCPSVRVLFISGLRGGTQAADPVPEGTSFLKKPFTATRLIEAVRKSLDRDERQGGGAHAPAGGLR